MIYAYRPPSPFLREFIRDYLIADFAFNRNESIPYKPYSPKPEQTITFIPKGHLTITNPITGQSYQSPKVSICGQQVSRYNFYLSQEYTMIRVHFHPGVLNRFLQVPLSHFTDQWCDGESIYPDLHRVNERLSNTRDYDEMISIVEEYLLSEIKKAKIQTHSVDKVASVILNDPSRFSLDWLADQACLSPRQFNRKFIERMGIGPKLYGRVVRFYKAYQYRETHPNEDWLSVSLLFGYSDYHHMVKDFKEFSHVAPNSWIREDNLSPERILRLE